MKCGYSMKIYLIGLPYSGKSTIGKLLAEKLNLNFLDIDSMIENRYKTTISKIFEEEGEISFRNHEKTMLEDVKLHKNTVISTGGGIVLDRNNKFLMEGLIIFIDTSIEVLKSRMEDNLSRPILKNSTIEELYEKRRKNYYFFNTFIVNGNKDALDVCNDIISLLKKEDLL